MMRKHIMNQRGITMMSLVITIVVMTILSSITITSVVGENGLLNKMRGVKESSEKRVAKEELKSDIIMQEVSNGAITDEALLHILENYGTVTYEEDGTTIKGVTISTGEEILISEVWSGTIIPTQEGTAASGLLELNPPVVSTNLTASANRNYVNLSIGVTDVESGFGKVEFMHKLSSAQNYSNTTLGTGGVIWSTDPQTVTATIYLSNGEYKIKAKVYDAAKNYVETEEITVIVNGTETGVSVWNAEKGVQTPALSKGMIPIKWDDTKSKWVITTELDTSWYEYSTSNKKWANVMLSDGKYYAVGNVEEGYNKTNKTAATAGQEVEESELGSMFVWIPRYAYKITSNCNSSSVGTISVVFVATDNTNGLTTYSETYPTVTAGVMQDYVVHPSFIDDESKGGWDEELPGIWVAKFEASAASYSNGVCTSQNPVATTTSYNVRVIPNVQSWRYESIIDMYTVCQNMKNENNIYGITKIDDTKMAPHLIKNSEWGAVTYLAQSQYGRNGAEVAIHADNYITGHGSSYPTTYANQSTTGNVYGIYDMNGGSWEYVSAYITGTRIYIASSNSTVSDKYHTVYTTTYEDNSHYGDAVKETSSVEGGESSWNNDYAHYPDSDGLFFSRGGAYYGTYAPGLFGFYGYNGDASTGIGFRPVLVVQRELS